MCKKAILNLCVALSLLLSLAACQPHRIEIQQGNEVKPEVLQKLEVGMTRQQVLYLLGTPLLTDPFHQDRWDYIYYLKPGNEDASFSRLTLFFDGDRLKRIDDSAYKPNIDSSENELEVDKDPAPEMQIPPGMEGL